MAMPRAGPQLGGLAVVLLCAATADSAPGSGIPPVVAPRGAIAAAAESVDRGDAAMQRTREFVDGTTYRDAELAYRNALALDPASDQAMVGLAWVRNSEHAFAEGRQWAERALLLNPRSGSAHALLGDAATELGDYAAAFEHYQRALDLQPDLASYSRAAQLLWITGDVPRARLLMRQAVAAGGSQPEHVAWCRAQLALMLWHEGSLVEAELLAREALRIAPRNPVVLDVMGRIAASRGDYAEAISLYERAARIHPSLGTLAALGDVYEADGQKEQALAQRRRVLDLHAVAGQHRHDDHLHNHDSSTGDWRLARYFADHDLDLGSALAEAESAYRVERSIFAADALAWCHYKNGNYEVARALIEEAIRYRTPDAMLYYHAGLIHARLGDRHQARRHLERALSLNARFDPIRAGIAARTLASLAAAGEGRCGPGIRSLSCAASTESNRSLR